MRPTALWMVALAALALALPPAWQAATAEEKKAEPKKAPAFTLENVDGKKVSLSDYADKVVVLEWGSPHCPPWMRVHKAGTFRTLAEKYKDKGVVWLQINSNRKCDRETNRKFAEQEKLTFPYLDDHTQEVAKAYGAQRTPHMFIIDKNNVIVYEGAIDDDPSGKKEAEKRINYVDQALAEILAGKPVSVPLTKPYG
ncbi:MAG: thioredoxin family protein [Planctomycetes bacterium]|nr:thioredoxin family protein [Planctomycetota bacterium]